MDLHVFADWPDAPLTKSLVLRALDRLSLHLIFVSLPSANADNPTLQWATYDSIDHELTLARPSSVLASSFTIRKALIRKHFLHRCILAYTTKHPNSSLLHHVPRTWDIEISHADELDELWSDELWDLAEELGSSTDKWWILKPGMADRGMGIRLFNSKEALYRIFEEFDEIDDATGNAEDATTLNTNILTSQLRHFVIQEYLACPVLLDPNEPTMFQKCGSRKRAMLEGRKFHLRAYCIASGALTVYLYPRILALFSSEPYRNLSAFHVMTKDLDLRPHLTNTCLQGAGSETNVFLLNELIGCSILSGDGSDFQDSFEENDVVSIMDQISDTLSESFKAAIQMPVHFQPLPNAFELYGVDFLVGHGPSGGTDERFQVKLLEFNSEPAIEMTGNRLQWILEDLFELMAKTCVEPFFNEGSKISGSSCFDSKQSCALRKCLDVNLRG